MENKKHSFQMRQYTDEQGEHHMDFECPDCKIWNKIIRHELIDAITYTCEKCGLTEHASISIVPNWEKH